MKSPDTVAIDDSVSHASIEHLAESHFRNSLKVGVVCTALFGTVYLSLPTEAQTNIRDFLGVVGEGYGDGINKINGYSDQPTPIDHHDLPSRALGEVYVIPRDIAAII